MILKFRAWDKNTNDMVDVKTIDLEKDGSIGCIVDYNGINLDMTECIIMQSTGIKDKNGVEIFEGDIVSVRNH
ncbi:YopX family protein, partial [Enterococcus faecalis]